VTRLIVTADDFGSSRDVNEAVEAGHRRGILTSASLMVSGAAAGEAVAMAKRLPRLRVGLHLTLVDGSPTLPPSEVAPLLGGDGSFRTDLAWAGVDMFFRPSVRSALAREIRAQFEAFRKTGLPLNHLDAHHHMHIHPTLARLALLVGRDYGVKAVRLPREPLVVIAATGDLPKGARRNGLLRPWIAILERRLRREGLLFNEHLFGLAWTGAVTAERVLKLLPLLPPGLSELYCHPRAGNVELDALVAPAVAEAVASQGVELVAYS
jgi:hopanoid biosynthesis associated protein HpnK